MTRRLHLDDLRHCDPVTLDIQVQEPLRRPIVQLSAATIADMVALSEIESLSRLLRQRLVAFTERMSREVVDLPNGEPVESFLTELGELAPERVPTAVREAVAHEATRDSRADGVRAHASELVTRWSGTPPVAAAPGTSKPKIQRMTPIEAPEDKPKRTPAHMREEVPREPTPKAAPRVAPVKVVDEDRRKMLVELCLDRLTDYREQGLKEDVLVAGIRHRARTEYADVSPLEIVGVLKELQEVGRVRHSAGRWKRVVGSW